VSDQIILRHCIIADNWLLHATRRSAGTAMERTMFTRFEREWSAQLRPVFRETRRALDLISSAWTAASMRTGVLLFEANPCMNILKNSSPSPNMWDAPTAKIKLAVEECLTAPAMWYAAEGGHSRGEPAASRPPGRLTA
jgi:hypothetical protein